MGKGKSQIESLIQSVGNNMRLAHHKVVSKDYETCMEGLSSMEATGFEIVIFARKMRELRNALEGEADG